ncbi:hypothetical protein JHK87_004807 [Glycine soja]|nr:hypothetical protein JHK87_004807 [Glycine soja]
MSRNHNRILSNTLVCVEQHMMWYVHEYSGVHAKAIWLPLRSQISHPFPALSPRLGWSLAGYAGSPVYLWQWVHESMTAEMWSEEEMECRLSAPTRCGGLSMKKVVMCYMRLSLEDFIQMSRIGEFRKRLQLLFAFLVLTNASYFHLLERDRSS